MRATAAPVTFWLGLDRKAALHIRGWLLVRVAIGVIALFGIAPGAASAAFTSSHITAPANGRSLTFDDKGATSAHFAGSVSPHAPGTTADIICKDVHQTRVVVDHVPTDPSTGHFQVDASLKDILPAACRLHAVPDSTNVPSDLSSFTGPKVTVSGRRSGAVTTGSNVGKPEDYYIASMRFTAGSDFDSFGSCGLDDSYLVTPSLDITRVFYCNAFVPAKEPGNVAPLRIDGHPSYSPGGTYAFPQIVDTQPFPAINYSYHRDPATGNLTIHETDHFVRCAPQPDTFPPTAASCSSFVDTGVKVDRTIVADHGQRLARFFDRWSSTDGHAHPLAVQYENDQCVGGPGACSQHLGYRFPGSTAYKAHGVGDVVHGPLAAPGTIFIKDTTAADGDPTRGQGATTYSVAPDEARFIDGGIAGAYLLDYAGRTIPATGSLNLAFGYATAYTTARVRGLSRTVEDQFGPLRVRITRPRSGSYTANRSTVVRGRATGEVASLKLNGKAVRLRAGGAFSKRVKLRAGRNRLTAVARDAAGHRARGHATVVAVLAKTGKSRARKHGRRIVVDEGEALVCPAGGRACAAKLTAKTRPRKHGHAVKIGKATVRARPGKRRELTFSLNRAGGRALKASKRVKASLAIRVRVGRVAVPRAVRSLSLARP